MEIATIFTIGFILVLLSVVVTILIKCSNIVYPKKYEEEDLKKTKEYNSLKDE